MFVLLQTLRGNIRWYDCALTGVYVVHLRFILWFILPDGSEVMWTDWKRTVATRGDGGGTFLRRRDMTEGSVSLGLTQLHLTDWHPHSNKPLSDWQADGPGVWWGVSSLSSSSLNTIHHLVLFNDLPPQSETLRSYQRQLLGSGVYEFLIKNWACL